MTTPQETRPGPFVDWQKANEYPQGANVPMQQWAWEFLRRNPAYQADWLKYAETRLKILPEWTPDKRIAPDESQRVAGILCDDERFKVYEPPKLPNEDIQTWLGRVEKGKIWPVDVWYGAKYGLQNFPSPYSEYRAADPRFMTVPAASFVGKAWEGFPDYGPPRPDNRFRAIGIDLALPIKPQLRNAQAILEIEQAKLIERGVVEKRPNKRNRNKEWCDLLRILDAKACNASPAQLAAVFFPESSNEYPDYQGQKNCDQRLNAAQAMAEEGYRYITMIPE